MLQKPKDYEQAEAYDSDFERLPVGGYVCEIKKMEEMITPRHGTLMVVVSFDIAEGEFKDYFARQYRREKARELTSGREAKWRGVYNLFPYTNEGLTNPSFKGLLVCIEKSNNQFRLTWPLKMEDFKGRKIGLLFREEEYRAADGTIKTSVKPCATRTVECITLQDFNVPAKRTLSKNEGSAASGKPSGSDSSLSVYSSQNTPVDEDDDLPF